MKANRYRAAACALMVCSLSCTRAVYVQTADVPDIPGSIMSGATEGWPNDTAGGLYATGQSVPMDSSTNRVDLENMAERGALSRMFGKLRERGIGTTAVESAFLICMEQQSRNAFIRKRELRNSRIEVDIFVKAEYIQSLGDCLGGQGAP